MIRSALATLGTFLLLGVIVCVTLVVADPPAARQAETWLQARLSQLSSASAGDACQGSGAAAGCNTPAPSVTRTPPPHITLAPLGTPAPTPAPAPPRPRVSAADASWAAATLDQDAALDRDAEQRYPDQAGWYAQWSEHWTACAEWITQAGNGTAPPAAAQPCPGWFGQAITGHADDERQNPWNAWWDDRWIANYRRLERIWAGL